MIPVATMILATTSAWSALASSCHPDVVQHMERQFVVQRGEQGWVSLVYSVLLTALLSGCPSGSGDGGFAGTWQGMTSQGKHVSFVVANDQTITTVTAGAHITGNACTFDDEAFTSRDFTNERPAIVGNQFSLTTAPISIILIFPPPSVIVHLVMTGTFANESAASEELQFTAACSGTATATFQVRKQ